MGKNEDLKQLTENLVVLYVDEKTTRDVMKLTFSKYFNSLELACDGKEALKKYKELYQNKKYFYDIVITDLEMPNMSGFELIKELKKINPTVHCIVFSAYNDYTNLKEAVEIGVDGFLEKPFEKKSFICTIYSTAKSILSKGNKKFQDASSEKAIQLKTEKIQNDLKIDPMTNLQNNIALFEVLETPNEKIAILLDVDRYSNINYTYGVEFGDNLLMEIVSLLKQTVPKNGELFRLGSDEFILLLDGTMEEAEEYAKIVVGFFKTSTITYKNIDVSIDWNIGISGEKEDKISTAKVAVRLLKDNPGFPYKVYKADSNLIAKQKENIYKAHILKNLLEKDSIVPYFQQIVDVHTREIVKYEALARIVDRDNTYTPESFIEAAKTTKLLSVVTKNMISKSFKIAKTKNIDIALNITHEDFNNNYLIDFLKFSLSKHSLEPTRITLEILEDVTMNNQEHITSQMKAIKDLGFLIAIDDFGSENANFSRLLDIKADLIKIDGMFIRDIDTNEESVKIVRSIIFLAKQMGAKTVAEYVKDEKIFNIVKDLGIDYAQGYLFGKPEKNLNF